MPSAAVRMGQRPTEGEKESRGERAAAAAAQAATTGLINSEEQPLKSDPLSSSRIITLP